MAQTTCLVLFGPVFIVPAQFITDLVIRTYIHSRTFVSIKKKTKKNEKKKLTYGPNNVSDVVWACFHCPCPIHHVSSYLVGCCCVVVVVVVVAKRVGM